MKATNRIPPQNIEAEQGLLGTILLIGFSILFNAFNSAKNISLPERNRLCLGEPQKRVRSHLASGDCDTV